MVPRVDGCERLRSALRIEFVQVLADMLGDPNNKLHFVWWLGPGFILRPLNNQYLKIMGTCLFAMPGMGDALAAGAQEFEPLVIVASQFL